MTHPNVDVVIPAFGQVGLVIKCIECLRGQPRLGRIILVDDNSEKIEAEVMQKIEGADYNKNHGEHGFIRATTLGVKRSDSPYFLLLNSDCFLKANAIKNMAQNLDQGFAICGARLIFARGSRYGQEGTIQHAGIGFNMFGVPYHVGMNMPGDEPFVLKWRSINAVTGACMMIKREIWDRVNGWDRHLSLGVYEDCDLCLSIRKLGYEIAYEPKALGEHLMHGSQTNERNFFRQDLHDNNLAYLFTKHGQPRCDDDLWYNMRG